MTQPDLGRRSSRRPTRSKTEHQQLFLGRLDGRTKRIALAAGAGAAQRFIALLGTALVFPEVLHALGPVGFGIWGAASSLTMLVTVADFGIGPAIVTLVAHAVAGSEPDRARNEFTAALIMAVGVSVAVAVFGSAATLMFAPKDAVAAYLLAVGGIALNVPLSAANSAWLAIQRGWMAVFADFLQTVAVVAAVVTATHISHNLLVYVGIIYGALLFASGSNMTYLLLTRPELRLSKLSVAVSRLGAVVQTGGRYFVLSGLDALSYMFDTVLALQLLGNAASGEMAIVQRICAASLGLLMVVAQPLWPAFVEAAARGERTWIVRTLVRGAFLMSATAITGSAILVFAGQPLLRLWLGHGVVLDRHLFWIMALWIVSLSLVRVQMLLLNALRILEFQVAILALATFTSLALKLVLAPRYGLAGVLFPTAAVFPVIVFPALIWRIARWNRRHPATLAAASDS